MLEVLLPVFCLLVLGAAARSSGLLEEAFWRPAERLTYFVLFPALIASTLAEADLTGLPWAPMSAGIAGSILVVTIAVLGAGALGGVDGPRLTSLYQGAVRMNTYIGLAVASRLAGEEGLAHAAVAIAVIVPTVNVASVAALRRLGEGGTRESRNVVTGVLTNPLIIACLVGFLLNALRIGRPPVIGEVAVLLGRGALPMGLLAVGASLRWGSLARLRTPELLVTGVKLVALPLLAGASMTALGVDGVAHSIGVLFAALPTAPSSYLLARQLGGDAYVMVTLITAQTVFSMATLPVVVGWLGGATAL